MALLFILKNERNHNIILQQLTVFFFVCLVGRLDVTSALKGIAGDKIVTFHRNDGIIPFEEASLYFGM